MTLFQRFLALSFALAFVVGMCLAAVAYQNLRWIDQGRISAVTERAMFDPQRGWFSWEIRYGSPSIFPWDDRVRDAERIRLQIGLPGKGRDCGYIKSANVSDESRFQAAANLQLFGGHVGKCQAFRLAFTG